MMAVPQDEKAQLEAYLIRMQHLSTAGKFLWPIPDKGLKKRLHRIKAPTLILWGVSDRLAPPVYAEDFRARIPNAQVRMVEEAGHVLPLEQQDAFVNAVREFVG